MVSDTFIDDVVSAWLGLGGIGFNGIKSTLKELEESLLARGKSE